MPLTDVYSKMPSCVEQDSKENCNESSVAQPSHDATQNCEHEYWDDEAYYTSPEYTQKWQQEGEYIRFYEVVKDQESERQEKIDFQKKNGYKLVPLHGLPKKDHYLLAQAAEVLHKYIQSYSHDKFKVEKDFTLEHVYLFLIKIIFKGEFDICCRSIDGNYGNPPEKK